jgi:mono/diheme cytochrome c family protein
MSIRVCVPRGVALCALMVGCVNQPNVPFTEPVTLGGEQVEASVLNEGQAAYAHYCVACHGKNGDGRGPAANGLRTPPRDFRVATYKFAGVSEGLPHDDALVELVRKGLDGTAMLPWMVPNKTLNAIIQYTKTFSPEGEGWRDPDSEKGTPVTVGDDPWRGKESEAVKAGEALYHTTGSCYSCHPSYVTNKTLNAHRAALNMSELTQFRARLSASEAKSSDSYSRPVAGDPKCDDKQPCDGAQQVCRYGRCEEKVLILPPDFSFNRLRTGTTTAGVARVIAAGIPGTAMPRWKDAIPDKSIWAIAHYVASLTKRRGTPATERTAGTSR